jgi:DNA end-binding protein Ku
MATIRSVGNVDLAIGLVTCPVKMVGVGESHDRRGSMYHQHDDGSYGKVKMPKSCEDCGAILQAGQISKGFEENGDLVVLSPDELETIAANTGTSVEVAQFVDVDEIDPMLFAGENTYRLLPDPKRGRQAIATYLTLRRHLDEHGLAGVVQYTRWGRNRLGLLCVEPTEYGGVLVIRNIMWPDELRSPAFDELASADESTLDPRLAPVMQSVVESMTAPWDSSAYIDTYTEQLSAAIEAKASGGEVVVIGSGAGDGGIDDISDLLAKLEASARRSSDEPDKSATKKSATSKKKIA